MRLRPQHIRIPRAELVRPRIRFDRRLGWRLLSAVVTGLLVVNGLGLGVFGWFDRAPAALPQVRHAAGKRVPLVQYDDPEGRFRISYPKKWKRLPSSDPNVALLARQTSESRSSLLVRTATLKEPVDPDDVAAVKKFTGELLAGSNVRVLVAQPITVNKVPGYYYLYTFGKPGSGTFGIHAHYFLFPRPDTLHILVMQALPDTEFVHLAPVFDRIARSYHPG